MIDIKYLKENLDEIKKALSKKHALFDLDKILKLDDDRKSLQVRVEELRAKQNKLTKDNIDEAKKIKEMLKDLEPQLREATELLEEESAKLHNVPDQSVPSKDEGDKVEKEWGKIPQFSFPIKDHAKLGKILDIIDIERAAKVSGTRFYYLKGAAVLLEFALINYVTEKLIRKNFTPIIPPSLVHEKAMFGTGFFPAEKNEIYKINSDEDNLFLAGTAEVPLASYHSDEILDNLPKKYFGFSTCFRREAGSYGKDTKGIIRAHQFDKIEMFVFPKPENSWQEFEALCKINEEIFQELELPYRQVNINAGELGAPNAKKIDTEVWIPSQEKFRELTSCSNDTDFQARRLNIKYKTSSGETKFVHTLNDTALAIGRTLVAIIENYQQSDGSILIPKNLRKYTRFKKIEQ